MPGPQDEFLEALAGATPAPGAGAAAARAGAMGAALIEMCSPGPAAARVREAASRLRSRLMDLADRDPAVVRAFFKKRCEANLQPMCEVPLEILEAAREARRLIVEAQPISNPKAVADLRAAGHLIDAAAEIAEDLARVNLALVQDRGFRRESASRLNSLP